MDLSLRRRAGVVAWVGGLGIAVVWGALDDGGAEGVGYGFAPPVEVSALETARILEVPVSLHQQVSADQVVVRMDPAPLVEEREIVSAQLLAIQEDEASSAAGEARRFAEGVQGVMIDKVRLSSQLQEDLVLVETLRERLSLEEALAQTGASSVQAVEEWKRQIRVVEARIKANRSAVAVASDATKSAVARNDALTGGGNQWAVVAATRALEHMDGRISRMDLLAGVEGQVTWIYRAPGEVVAAGEPVLQVRRMATNEVVAFLDASVVVGLEAGESASVQRSSGQVIRGRLLSVGSGPQPLPEQLWHNPAYPEYGVPVRLELDGEVAPDEPVSVRL